MFTHNASVKPITKKLVLAAMLAAMTCVATMIIQIPLSANGYVNMGDAVVLFTAYLLGPLYGAAAGGVGSMLADLISGYVIFVPATFIIKALMAAAAGYMFKRLSDTKLAKPVSMVICGIVGEAIMVVGYFAFAAIFLLDSAAAAAAEIPGNLLQGAFGIIVSTILSQVVRIKVDD